MAGAGYDIKYGFLSDICAVAFISCRAVLNS